ncbi:MAG: restriction endonuclease subunit R, partial [Deltaproteobacteria bacterium HGW-Deltaproteobacteria-21]
MKIVLSNNLNLSDVPKAASKIIRDRLTFANPKWIENDRLGYWNGNTPRYLEGFTRTGGGLILPRGFIRQLIGICGGQDRCEVIDQRRTLPEVSFTFSGTLKPFQEQAVKEVMARDFGTLSAPTGSGKTVMALSIVAQRRQPALVLCHTKELADQWVERIGTFLSIPKDEIGMIGNGRRTVGERITVALVQSLYKCAAEVAAKIGHLIIDETHRAPA